MCHSRLTYGECDRDICVYECVSFVCVYVYVYACVYVVCVCVLARCVCVQCPLHNLIYIEPHT